MQQAYQKLAYYETQAQTSNRQAQILQQRSQLLEQQQLHWPLYEEWCELENVKESVVSEEKTRKLQQFHQRYQQLSEEIQNKEAELAQLESGQTSERYFLTIQILAEDFLCGRVFTVNTGCGLLKGRAAGHPRKQDIRRSESGKIQRRV